MMLSVPAFQVLSQGLRERSPAALAALVMLVDSTLLRLARAQLPSWLDYELRAEDFTQELYLWLLTHTLPEAALGPLPGLVSYLAAILHNNIVDARRHLARQKNGAHLRKRFEDVEAAANAIPESCAPPVEPIDRTVFAAFLRQRLSPRDCRIVELRLNGHSEMAVANEMDIERRTVQRAIHLARDWAAEGWEAYRSRGQE